MLYSDGAAHVASYAPFCPSLRYIYHACCVRRLSFCRTSALPPARSALLERYNGAQTRLSARCRDQLRLAYCECRRGIIAAERYIAGRYIVESTCARPCSSMRRSWHTIARQESRKPAAEAAAAASVCCAFVIGGGYARKYSAATQTSFARLHKNVAEKSEERHATRAVQGRRMLSHGTAPLRMRSHVHAWRSRERATLVLFCARSPREAAVPCPRGSATRRMI